MQDSKIEWTDHTHNGWRGCVKVSEGCRFCYADAFSGRNPNVLGKWGAEAQGGTRSVASEDYWRHPARWARRLATADPSARQRVFCHSLSDVFEDWRGPMLSPQGRIMFRCPRTNDWFEGASPLVEDPQPPRCPKCMEVGARITMQDSRDRLFATIRQFPNLDFLLLTKRPQNAARMLPPNWMREGTPPNIWIGASVENQEAADERIPHLLAIPSAVRFLSMEPLLGPINLRRYLPRRDDANAMFLTMAGHDPLHWGIQSPSNPGIGWAIIGGESGRNARPCQLDWIRDLAKQLRKANVPTMVKQVGAKPIPNEWFDESTTPHTRRVIGHPKGEDRSEWPPDLAALQASPAPG